MKKILLLIALSIIFTGCAQTQTTTNTNAATPQANVNTNNNIETEVTDNVVDIERGEADPDLVVSIYKKDKAYQGTTLTMDHHQVDVARIIEINMLGEIVWEYVLPDDLKNYTNPGPDVEALDNGNILFVLPGKGVYEINRDKEIVWTYLDPKVSHDADRLPSGNTLVAFGADDQINEAQVKEVNLQGEIVWSWYAKDEYNTPEYRDISMAGWTHTNAVIRLDNGNTLISPRNFNFLVEVDPQGKTVRTIGQGVFEEQHEPEIMSNGNLLIANQKDVHRALQIDMDTDEVLWEYPMPRDTWPIRDADELPNGNILITGTISLTEVTPDQEIVWQLDLKNVPENKQGPKPGFYKAERISQ